MTTRDSSVKAYLAVKLVRQVQTDEVCDHLRDGKKPSGNVKLLGKKRVGYHGMCRDWGGREGKKVLLTAAVHRH
jgi:hypothetical protein